MNLPNIEYFNFVGSGSTVTRTYTTATCVIFLVVYHIIIEIILFCSSTTIFVRTRNCLKTPYIRNPQNYVKLILYAMSIIFVFVFFNDCGCPTNAQWQIGLIAMFLGWLNLIFLAYNFPGTGLYVIMFKTIFFTFFKLVLFAVLLIYAFSVILFMMFHDPTAKVSHTKFRTCKQHCLHVILHYELVGILKPSQLQKLQSNFQDS